MSGSVTTSLSSSLTLSPSKSASLTVSSSGSTTESSSLSSTVSPSKTSSYTQSLSERPSTSSTYTSTVSLRDSNTATFSKTQVVPTEEIVCNTTLSARVNPYDSLWSPATPLWQPDESSTHVISGLRCTLTFCAFLTARGEDTTVTYNIILARNGQTTIVALPSTLSMDLPQLAVSAGTLQYNDTCFFVIGRRTVLSVCPTLTASVVFTSLNLPIDGRDCYIAPLYSDSRVTEGMLAAQCDDALIHIPIDANRYSTQSCLFEGIRIVGTVRYAGKFHFGVFLCANVTNSRNPLRLAVFSNSMRCGQRLTSLLEIPLEHVKYNAKDHYTTTLLSPGVVQGTAVFAISHMNALFVYATNDKDFRNVRYTTMNNTISEVVEVASGPFYCRYILVVAESEMIAVRCDTGEKFAHITLPHSTTLEHYSNAIEVIDAPPKGVATLAVLMDNYFGVLHIDDNGFSGCQQVGWSLGPAYAVSMYNVTAMKNTLAVVSSNTVTFFHITLSPVDKHNRSAEVQILSHAKFQSIETRVEPCFTSTVVNSNMGMSIITEQGQAMLLLHLPGNSSTMQLTAVPFVNPATQTRSSSLPRSLGYFSHRGNADTLIVFHLANNTAVQVRLLPPEKAQCRTFSRILDLRSGDRACFCSFPDPVSPSRLRVTFFLWNGTSGRLTTLNQSFVTPYSDVSTPMSVYWSAPNYTSPLTIFCFTRQMIFGLVVINETNITYGATYVPELPAGPFSFTGLHNTNSIVLFGNDGEVFTIDTSTIKSMPFGVCLLRRSLGQFAPDPRIVTDESSTTIMMFSGDDSAQCVVQRIHLNHDNGCPNDCIVPRLSAMPNETVKHAFSHSGTWNNQLLVGTYSRDPDSDFVLESWYLPSTGSGRLLWRIALPPEDHAVCEPSIDMIRNLGITFVLTHTCGFAIINGANGAVMDGTHLSNSTLSPYRAAGLTKLLTGSLVVVPAFRARETRAGSFLVIDMCATMGNRIALLVPFEMDVNDTWLYEALTQTALPTPRSWCRSIIECAAELRLITIFTSTNTTLDENSSVMEYNLRPLMLSSNWQTAITRYYTSSELAFAYQLYSFTQKLMNPPPSWRPFVPIHEWIGVTASTPTLAANTRYYLDARNAGLVGELSFSNVSFLANDDLSKRIERIDLSNNSISGRFTWELLPAARCGT